MERCSSVRSMKVVVGGIFRIKAHCVSRSLDSGQDVRVQEAPVYGFWFSPRAFSDT